MSSAGGQPEGFGGPLPTSWQAGGNAQGPGQAFNAGMYGYSVPPSSVPPWGSDPQVTAYAMSRVSGPAIGLLIAGLLDTAFAGLSILVTILFLLNGGQMNDELNKARENFGMPRVDAEVQRVQMVVSGVAAAGVNLILGALIVVGALRMRQLRNRAMATTAAILAIICWVGSCCMTPCCLACTFLGMPFGIWALVVLHDPYVKSAFRS
jgi:predicted PurR-regulated permease PerM